MGQILEAALSYALAGHRVFPIWGVRPDGSCQCPDMDCTGNSRGKHPYAPLVPRGLHQASDDEDQIAAWWRQYPAANIGLVTGERFFVIDCDKGDDYDGTRELLRILAELGITTLDTACADTGGGGAHFCFAYDSELVTVRNQQALLFRGDRIKGIDVRGEGGYIVAPPSIHWSGNRYTWRDEDGLDGLKAAEPALLQLVAGIDQAKPAPVPAAAIAAPVSSPAPSSPSLAHDVKQQIEAALEKIPPNEDRTTWVERVSMPLHDMTAGSEEGFELWHAWCQRGRGLMTPNGNPAYGGERECRKVWRSFSAKHRNPKGAPTFWEHAQRHGWRPPEPTNGGSLAPATSIDFWIAPDQSVVDAEELAAALDGPEDPGDFPLSVVVNLRGPIADAVDWIQAAARRPDAVLAFASALGMVAGALGRRVVGPGGTRPTIAIAVLAPSGSGKDKPQECLKNLFESWPNLQVGLFDDTPTHRTQLDERLLKNRGQVLMVLDEYGAALRRWLNPSDLSSSSMSPTIRRLATHGATVYHLAPVSARHPSRAADVAAWDAGIFAPAFSLIGFATPGQFYEALSESSLVDGFLGRHVVIASRSANDLTDPKVSSLRWPVTLADWLDSVEAVPVPRTGPPSPARALAVPDAPVVADSAPDKPLEVRWASEHAHAAWLDLTREIDAAAHKAVQADDEALTAILRRLPGQIAVLALVLACGEADRLEDAAVEERHLDLAARVARWSSDHLAYRLRRGIAVDDFGRAHGRLCDIIEARGARKTYRSAVGRKLWLAPHLKKAWALVAEDPRYVVTERWAHVRQPGESGDS